MGSLLLIFMPSLHIAIFIYPFPVQIWHTVKGQFLTGLLYALAAIVPLMNFLIGDVSNTKGHLKSQGCNADSVDN